MFTRTIRSHILGKSAVKWDAKELSISVPEKSTYEQLMDTKLTSENRKALLNKLDIAEVSRLQVIFLEKMKNGKLWGNQRANEVLDQLRDVFTEKSKSITKVAGTTPSATTSEIANAVVENKETTTAGLAALRTDVNTRSNNLSFQARQFGQYIDSVKGIDTAMTSFATHLKTVNLKNTNIPSLLRSLVDSAPYVADGMFGPSEKSAVKSITEFYTKNPSIKPALEQILAYYDANMTSDHAFRGIAHRNSLSVDATSVKKFLADLNQDGDATDNTTDKKHRGDTAWIKEGTLENSLNGLNDTQLVSGVNNILALAGTTTNFADLNALVQGIKGDANIYPKFVQGVNIALRNGSLNQVLRTGSISLLDNKTSKFIDFLETPAGIDAVKESIKTKVGAISTAVESDPKLSDEEKQAALKAIQESESKINDPVFLEQVSRDFSVAITNHRLGVGASSTHSLESLLADNMTVGVFVGKEFSGGYAGGLGISFDKNLISGKGYDANLIYGVGWTNIGVTPFAGLAGGINDWKVAAIGSAVGGDLYVGKKLGNLDSSIARARELSNTTGLGKMMDTFSKDSNNIANTFVFTASEFDQTAYDKLTSEQKSQSDTLANKFSTGTALRLEKAGFDTEKNPLKRYLMVQVALSDTVQQYIDTLNIDAVKSGWSTKEIGAHMGVMASIPYILPSISFGKKDVVFEEKTVKHETLEKVEEQKDIATELAKLGYSLGKPVIALDKQSYSISLEKVANFDASKLGKIETKLNFDKNKLTLSNLTKGLNISIQNGTIMLSQNSTEFLDTNKTNNATLSPDRFEAPEKFKELLKNVDTRVQIARLTTDKTQNGGYKLAQDFTSKIDTIDWTNNASRNELVTSLKAFLSKGAVYKYTSLQGIADSFNKVTDPIQIRAMLMEVRATMMTDSSQALGLNATGNQKSSKSIQTHWDNMMTKQSPLSGETLDKAMLSSGLTKGDFTKLINSKDNEFVYNEGVIQPNMVALVASWKFGNAGLKYMPAGTVRIAEDAKHKQYSKEIPDTGTKEKIFTEMKKNPDMTKIVDQIKSLGMNDAESATLITTGSVTVGMNKFSMKNTFTAFAYGKCMNPAYGIQFGEVIKNGNSIGTPNISAEILRVSDDIRSGARFHDTNISLLAGMEREKPTIKTPEQTEYKTEIQTRDVKVSPNDIKIVSGNEVVNIPGGGTVPTKQLTVAQRVALQNGTLTLKTQVTVTTPIITPGTTITPDTPRTTTNIVAILTLASGVEENGKHFSGEKIDGVMYPDFDMSKFKNTEAFKKFLTDNKFVPTK